MPEEGRTTEALEASLPPTNYNTNENVEEGSGDIILITFLFTLFDGKIL